MNNYVSIAPARADRASDHFTKKREATLDGPVFGYVGIDTILGTILDVF